MNSKPIIHKIFDEYGQNYVVLEILKINRSNGTKARKNKYAPISWFSKLIELTNNKYTKDDLLNDYIKYSTPTVNNSQVGKNNQKNGKFPTKAKKS